MLRAYCMIFILILFLPILQHNYKIFPSRPLVGVEWESPVAKWSLNGWLDGSFQQAYAKQRDARLGLRSYLVRTYNQLHFSLFHRVVSTSGTNVVLGKKNWLYEKAYIDKINMPSLDQGCAMEIQANSLRILQDTLAEQGTAFIFVLAPSKPEIYREYVPDGLVTGQLPAGMKTDYQYLREDLQKYGVHFIDSNALFMAEKQKKKFQLFPPSGTHWNKYGAYLVWKKIQQTIGKQIRVPLRGLELEKVESRPSESVEADLALLLNLWKSSMTKALTDYPVFVKQPKSDAPKPSLLVVGDSFLFTLIDIVQQAGLATDVNAWYYFSRHFKYTVKDGRLMGLPLAVETPLDRNNIDWENQMFNKDLVILVETKQWLPDVGFGFVQSALEAIKQRAVVAKGS